MAARTRSRYDDVDAKPKSDAYTGLLFLSFIALLASCVILWMDYSQYGGEKGGPKSPPRLDKIGQPGGPVNQGAPAGGGQAPADLPPLVAVPIAQPQPSTIITVAGTDEGPVLTPPQ